MSDMGLEEPDADAAEQKQDAVPEDENDVNSAMRQPPLEANEADAAEQKREVHAAEDEYR
ncbi:MAG TPA: hypothetical protein VEV45_03485 [Streptosporangiaceae bacterium]|nr:hypothetical protein [Streptosporangiaceae bacterium]